MKKAGIYTLVNKTTGKVYVGSSRDCDRRKSEHISRLRRGVHINAKLQAAWNKYGEEAFEFLTIFTVLDVSQIEAIEQRFLDESDAVRTGYNLAPTAGNTAGWKAPPETRKRMSEAAKRRDNSVQVQRMREAIKGRKRPQSEIDRIQATRRATYTHVSAETRAKMAESARARGCTSSPEHLERLRQMAIARARFTIDQMKEMAAMKDAGATLKQIGQRYGVAAESTVSMYVRKARSS